MSLKFKIWLLCVFLIITWKLAIVFWPPEDLRPYNLSTIDTVTIHYPRWACGPCADYMILTMGKDENQPYALTEAHVSPPAGFKLSERYYNESVHTKFTCIGKLKADPGYCLGIGDCVEEESKIFYADYCEKSEMTDEDFALKEKFYNAP